MTTVLTKADDEAQIRARLEDWAEATQSKDLDAVMSHYAPDVVAFDAIAALQFKGREAYRKHWERSRIERREIEEKGDRYDS